MKGPASSVGDSISFQKRVEASGCSHSHRKKCIVAIYVQTSLQRDCANQSP